MTDRIRLETPTSADADELARVHVESWRQTYRGLLPDAIIASLSIDRRQRQWRNWLATGIATRSRLARTAEGSVIGFVIIGKPMSVSDFADCELFALYLLAAHHGTGVGRRLLDEAVMLARSSGATALGLWVVTGNARAERFYRLAGAVAVAERHEDTYAETGYRLAL